jgi:hypothetical protein
MRFMETSATIDPFEEIRQLFRETASAFKETDARLDERIRETDARLDERIRETDARLDQRYRETDEKIRQLEGIFGNRWGRLIEALVKPGLLALFQQRGVNVRRLFSRAAAQANGDNMEVDLLMEGDVETVVGEVKSTMGVEDVREFLVDLRRFTHFFPRYAGFRIFGAVAALEFAEGADRFAYRQGLFVLSVQGREMVVIRNDENFRPHDFAADQMS